MTTKPYHHGDLPNTLRHAAADLIAERGAAGFSLREVARRAGVSHAAPAHHFHDSTGLLTSVAVEAFQHLHAAMVAAVDGVDDPVERLARIGRAYVEVSRSSPGHCAIVFRHDLVDATDPAYQEWGDRAHGQLSAAVTAIRDGCNADLDTDLAIAACWSAMQGLVQLYPNMLAIAGTHGQELPGIGDMAERFARLLAQGLLSPDTDAGGDEA
jgi:AcrR family transcriptional regulator